jgi:hypothetical protein
MTVPGVGRVVLTCHRVVVRVPPELFRIALKDGKRRSAWLDEAASQIGCDAAVMRPLPSVIPCCTFATPTG